MSRIYFHTKSGNTEVLGAERAYLGNTCGKLGGSMVPVKYFGDDHPLMRVLDPNSYFATRINIKREGNENDKHWYDRLHLQEESIRMLFESGSFMGDNYISFGGDRHEVTDLVANTCISLGPIPALMAKIHWMCENHGWVDGPDRAWFAGLIQQGLDTNMLRHKIGGEHDYSMGWEELIKFLGDSQTEAVFMSYSVCDSFAGHPPESWTPLAVEGEEIHDEMRQDRWYDLGDDERWDISEADMRQNHSWRQISPDTLQEQMFSKAKTLWDMMASDEWRGA